MTLPDCFSDRFGTGRPTTCIFRIAGIIDMNLQPTWNWPMKSNVHIAGQTAPGDGILLKNGTFTICGGSGCNTPLHDWIIRHIRIAPGAQSGFAGQGLTCYHCNTSIFDHNSFRWAPDDMTGAIQGSYDITWQWNIIGEGLNDTPSSPGQTSKALFWGSSGDTAKMTAHHNLLANVIYRAPYFASGNGQFINNVVYNIQDLGSSVIPDVNNGAAIHLDFLKNYYLRGPNTRSISESWPNGIYLYHCGAGQTNCTYVANSQVYVLDNYHDLFRPTGTEPQTALVGNIGGPPFITVVGAPTQDNTNVTSTSAAQARADVLARAGAYAVAGGSATVRRDKVDQRQVNDVNNLTGRLIRLETDICGNDLSTNDCGYGTYRNGTPYPDTDGDGMSDAWEDSHPPLNKNNPADGPQLTASGYSNLELFLQWLAGDSHPLMGSTAPPQPTPWRLLATWLRR